MQIVELTSPYKTTMGKVLMLLVNYGPMNRVLSIENFSEPVESSSFLFIILFAGQILSRAQTGIIPVEYTTTVMDPSEIRIALRP